MTCNEILIRFCKSILIVVLLLEGNCITSRAEAVRISSYKGILNSSNADIGLIGSVQGIVSRTGTLFAYVDAPSERQIQNLRQECIRTNTFREWKNVEGLTFRIKIHKVIHGTLEGDSVDVFCGSCSAFSQSIDPNTSFVIFLNKVHFLSGDGYVMPLGLSRPWVIPYRYTQAENLTRIGCGKPALYALLKEMILDVDSDLSSYAAWACACNGYKETVPMIRKRLLEHLLQQGVKDDLSSTAYLKALFVLGDVKSLVTYTDWLIAHPAAVKNQNVEGYVRLHYKKTPFEEENRQISEALNKLASADLGWLARAAREALAGIESRMAITVPSGVGLLLPQVEEDRIAEEKANSENLKKIYAAKVAWSEVNKNTKTNRVAEKDLAQYIKGNFPVALRGGSYEIGDLDEFPYYVPPVEEVARQKANKSNEPTGKDLNLMTASTPPGSKKPQMNDFQARMESCLNNLYMIDSGKEQWRLQNRIKKGDSVVVSEVNLFIKNAMTPVCPEGGTYTYNAIGVNPECSFVKTNSDGTILRHRLSR